MNTTEGKCRADCWLWAVRLFKTRSLAAEYCKKGRISINDISIKASRTIRKGEIISLRDGPITRTYEVLDCLERRVSAKLAVEYVKETTSEEELLKLKKIQEDPMNFPRQRGLGRPTKKDRRTMTKFRDED